MKRVVLEHIENIEIYPIISLIIFVALFVGVIIYAWKLDKKFINKLGNMPLDHQSNPVNHEKIC